MSQRTLTGEQTNRIDCEYYEGCVANAVYEIEAFMYDGYAWEYQDIVACERCCDEHFELETRDREEKCRRLKPEERYE